MKPKDWWALATAVLLLVFFALYNDGFATAIKSMTDALVYQSRPVR